MEKAVVSLNSHGFVSTLSLSISQSPYWLSNIYNSYFPKTPLRGVYQSSLNASYFYKRNPQSYNFLTYRIQQQCWTCTCSTSVSCIPTFLPISLFPMLALHWFFDLWNAKFFISFLSHAFSSNAFLMSLKLTFFASTRNQTGVLILLQVQNSLPSSSFSSPSLPLLSFHLFFPSLTFSIFVLNID